MNKLFKQAKFQYYFKMLFVVLLVWTVAMNSNIASAAGTHPYLIKVNRQMNTVTIYKQDKNGDYTVPIKAMACSTGGSNTLLGTFKTPAKYRWKLLMGDVWGQYSTRIKGGILFHSVWYYKQDPSTLSARQYNRLGTTASHGCIRLSVNDAKWIYDNCPVGTTVIVYDSSNPGPLGKPEALKLPESSGWDPTDPNPQNPWKVKKPVIQGAYNHTVKYGSKINLRSGITALSSTGNSISKAIKVTGDVNTKKPGKYKVTYEVIEASGKVAKKTIIYTVKEDDSKPFIYGVKNHVVNGNQVINKEFALKGITAKIGNKAVSKNNIAVKITKESSTRYKIQYTLRASNGNTKKLSSIVTVDSKAPVINGVTDHYVSIETDVNRTFALKGVTATDNGKALSKDMIKVSISDKNDYYVITYTVTDAAGNVTKKTAKYTIIDGAKIIGAKNQTVTSNVVVDKAFALKGVKAYVDAVDQTKNLKVSISEMVDNKYTITYEITDSEGFIESVTVTVKVIPNVTIVGAKNREVTKDQVVTKEFALEGITATEGTKDVTANIDVTISNVVDNKYTVTYTIVDMAGYSKQVVVTFTVR